MNTIHQRVFTLKKPSAVINVTVLYYNIYFLNTVLHLSSLKTAYYIESLRLDIIQLLTYNNGKKLLSI